MQLIHQLNDDELTDLLLQNDERDLQPSLNGLPDWLRNSTQLPDWFWQGQRAAIRRRISAKPNGWLRPVLSLATAMALIILALLLLRTNPAPEQVQLRLDPDQDLLVEVERTVQNEGPSALEPAALLADEIMGSSTTQPQATSQKENHHEN